MRPDWIDRANKTIEPEQPPRSGKGATTEAWADHAAALGYTIPADAGRNQIIDIVDAGPPPRRQPSRTPKVEGPVYEATASAVGAAAHLTDLDQPAVAVLLDLARTIDGFEERPSNAPLDNVTVPTFLKFAESLGLTPAARQRLDVKQPKPKSALDRAREAWADRAG